jgi:hypothetical protein
MNHLRGPEPSLSPEDAGLVDLIVERLTRAGAFAPEAPDPRDLHPAVADRGTATVVDVLRSLAEASYWRPGFQEQRHCANLAFHDTQVEQFADHLVGQAADLALLADGTMPVEVVEVHQEIPPSGSRRTPTQIRLTVAGRPLTLSYLGTTKDLSTVLHVEVGRALRTAGAPRRIAVLGEDGDLALVGLADQDLNVLNADLGLSASDPEGWGGWAWIDETEPYAAGHDAPT